MNDDCALVVVGSGLAGAKGVAQAKGSAVWIMVLLIVDVGLLPVYEAGGICILALI